MSMTSHGNGQGWELSGSGVRRISIATRSDKLLVRLPSNHFKTLQFPSPGMPTIGVFYTGKT
jgi:hypothetical protein